MKKFFKRFNISSYFKELRKKTDFKTFLKNAFTKNLVAKLLCLFGAVFLWFYVMDFESATYEHTFKNVKIEYTENANGMSVLSTGNQTVDVTLSGKRSVIKSMKNTDITAVVDISSITEAGNKNVEIVVSTSNETSVESVEPRNVNIYIDQSTKVPVEVVANFKGNTAYELDLSVSPSKIYVTGPAKELENIDHAKVTVNMGSQNLEKDTTVYGESIVLYGKNGTIIDSNFVQMSESSADVEIALYKTVTIPISAKLEGYDMVYDPRYVEVSVQPSTVVLRGRKDAIESLTVAQTLPVSVDVSDLSSEASVFNTKLDLPAEVTVAEGKNECEISVSVENYSERIFEIEAGPEVFMNLSRDYTAQVEGGIVLVKVGGVKQFVNQISEDDIEILINAQSFVVGTNDGYEVMAMIVNEEVGNVFAEVAEDFDASVIVKNN